MPATSKQAATGGSLIGKMFSRSATWTREELLTVLYWVRQVYSLIMGVLLGFASITGAVGLISYAVSSTLFIYYYAASYLGINSDQMFSEQQGAFPIITEGFAPSFAIFMVSICTILTCNFC